MLLSHRTPFCNEVWAALIEAVIREVDREWLRSALTGRLGLRL